MQSVITVVLTVGFHFLTVGGDDPTRGAHAIPYLVFGTFAVGLVLVFVLKMRRPGTYAPIGRHVYEEAKERE